MNLDEVMRHTQMNGVKEATDTTGMFWDGVKGQIEQQRKSLDSASVKYEETVKAKDRICQSIFQVSIKDSYLYRDEDFRAFMEGNGFWLAPYAAFCTLKKLFGHSDHSNWGSMKVATLVLLKKLITGEQEQQEETSPTDDSVDDFSGLSSDLMELFNPKAFLQGARNDFFFSLRKQIAYYCFVQFHLHSQFSKVATYAESKGIALKGDLPIGVDKNSVECWTRQECFRMEVCAGAPPDYYSTEGQNWGFPTYNWEEMKKDDYCWWKQRLSHMSNYFHAYRIDHILGFFRIWEVPASHEKKDLNSDILLPGLLGCFRPVLPLTRQELDSKGIWDIDRLCKPFISMDLLVELFGELSVVVSEFFLFKKHEYFEVKESFTKSSASFWNDTSKWGKSFVDFIKATQQEQQHSASAGGGGGDNVHTVVCIETVQRGLRALMQNVVLLRDKADANTFHPRFGCLRTHSFERLPSYVQTAISDFHDDYFFRRQENLWRRNATESLPKLLEASQDMLVCGEDLGMIPRCVPKVMSDLSILGLRIQRMPSHSSEKEFGNVLKYPYNVVTSPSCHDVLPLRAWWEDDYGRAKRLWQRDFQRQVQVDEMTGEAEPPMECKPFVAKAIFSQHLQSPACLMVAPMQDFLALSSEYNKRPAAEERINDPTNSKHFWCYRMHVTLEELAQDESFCKLISDMVRTSGRADTGGS
jgi:4-alpha-glucanotransferase